MTDIDLDYLREELLQCRRCGICRNAVYEDKGFDGICPVWKNSSGFETSFMRGKIQVALALLDGELEKTPENAESLFQCTLCGNCTQICAAEFNPAESLEQVRQVLSDIPNVVRDNLVEKIIKYDNPYSEDNTEKRKWIEGLGYSVPTKGNTLYYVGCTAGMRLPDAAVYTSEILKSAGIDFAVLDNEPCCGSVMIRTGKIEDAKTNAEKVEEIIRNSGAERVIVSCAGCLKTLRKDYPEKFGVKLPKTLHILEYAEELIKEGKLRPKKIEEVQVTYHDPCHMGRELGVYESPREVLKAIPGVKFVEMDTIRETAICCGAGGGLRSYDPDLSKNIGASRISEAEETGATIIATACPFCENNLLSGKKLTNSRMEVMDVVELLAKSIR
ncbi:MAG: CoB--CoM heterodisulfide reductase iron-sulfur subunit D [Candidatus Thorarchaeota archaeon]|nr:MAG: CoB--CoM heterodisulfide reductase iron-sulfur subunit D [Candidatus Thorarchaeota archaeon]